eukprot:6156392-Karenia_brevis.AAC.1
MQKLDEERVSLRRELAAKQKLMMDMAENIATMQNPNTSTSAGPKSLVPQRFDMEAPGGVGVAEKPK